jgi:hypothetical protein
MTCDHKPVKVMALNKDYQLCRKCGGMREAPNAKVSDGSQPPVTFDLCLRESAGSRSLHRLVGHSLLPQ